MARTEHKSITLIMARELASNLATPLFVVDPEGNLVFYNEPAEAILGKRYAEAGELKAAEWAELWRPTDLDGKPVPLEGLPLGIALMHRRPAHKKLRITSLDGTRRVIDVSAFPLMARADEFVGAVAIFWEESASG